MEFIAVIIGTALVAELVMVVGEAPPMVLLQANLRSAPAVPWFLPVTVLWLAVCWQYLERKGAAPRDRARSGLASCYTC